MTPPAKTGYYRWVICSLLFFATTINYVDRGVVGILKTTLQGEFGWNEIDYSNIVFAFQSAYAIGLMLAGRLMDKVGTKAGYAIALIVWSLAAVACAEATAFGPVTASLLATVGFVTTPSVAGFMAARFALGLGEGGNFPAAIKSVAEWFPRRERALATGIFNSGTNVGAIVTPLVVPWITVRYGWYWAFVITGALGFFWLIAWWLMYDTPDRHPRVTPAELAYINSDPPESTSPVPWARLFPHKEAWAFAIGKFMTDPIWWLYLFWLADFLQKKHGLSLSGVSAPLIVIYLVADVGSIGGGWLSSAPDQAGLVGERRTEDGDARVCAAGRARDVCAVRGQSLGGRRPGQRGGGLAPGLVREPLHVLVGHVSASRRGVRRRVRRHGRCDRGNVVHQDHRLHPGMEPKRLPAGFHHGGLCLSDRAWRHPPAGAGDQAGGARLGGPNFGSATPEPIV